MPCRMTTAPARCSSRFSPINGTSTPRRWRSRRSRRCASGKTMFVPAAMGSDVFNWMENIQPWCISRQIWWGHQIPVWYGPDGKIFVAESEDDAVADALAHYTEIEEITAEEGHDIAADPERRARFANEYLHRDDDVLDTWFSSALWPFSTLGWPDETPELKRFYPTIVAGHRLRHHLLLGRAHDDDGTALHERRAVPRRLHPRAGARRLRRQDVEVEGQRRRSAGTDRRIWRRRFALHARAPWRRRAATSSCRRSASRATAISRPSSGTRRALPRSTAARTIPISIRITPRRRSTAGSSHETAKAGREVTAAIEAYKFNEAAERALSLCLERVLRLVSRIHQAGAHRAGRRRQDRDARHRRVGARRNPQAAAPVHAVRHRRIVARHGRARAGASPHAGARCHGRRTTASTIEVAEGRDRLGDRSDHRDPLGARRNEHSGRDHVAAGAGGRFAANERSGAQHWSEFIQRLARVADISFADARAARRGAARRARRSRGAAAQGRDRSCRRTRAARQGNGQGRRRHRAASMPSSAIPISSRARRKRSSRKKKKSAKKRWRARPRSPRRWNG